MDQNNAGGTALPGPSAGSGQQVAGGQDLVASTPRQVNEGKRRRAGTRASQDASRPQSRPAGFTDGPAVKRGRRWRFPFPVVGVHSTFYVSGMTPTALSPYVCFANKRLAPKRFVCEREKTNDATFGIISKITRIA